MQNNPTEAPDWRAEFHRLEGAYAAGTIRSYRGDIAVFFEAWCAEEGIPRRCCRDPYSADIGCGLTS